MSGFNEQDLAQSLGRESPTGFIHKPFSLFGLRDRLQEVIGSVRNE
jgi:hypothetical protein